MEKGRLWTFFIAKESLEKVKKLDMCPYFGMGRLRFWIKEEDKQQGQEGKKEESSKTAKPETRNDPQGTNMAKREAEKSSKFSPHQPFERGVGLLRRILPLAGLL